MLTGPLVAGQSSPWTTMEPRLSGSFTVDEPQTETVAGFTGIGRPLNVALIVVWPSLTSLLSVPVPVKLVWLPSWGGLGAMVTAVMCPTDEVDAQSFHVIDTVLADADATRAHTSSFPSICATIGSVRASCVSRQRRWQRDGRAEQSRAQLTAGSQLQLCELRPHPHRRRA